MLALVEGGFASAIKTPSLCLTSNRVLEDGAPQRGKNFVDPHVRDARDLGVRGRRVDGHLGRSAWR